MALLTEDIISKFGTPTQIEVLRSSGHGTIVDGVVRDAQTERSFKIPASVQPMRGGAEMLILPEGERTRETYKVYSSEELLIANDVSKQKADTIKWRDKSFTVIAVERWEDSDEGVFFKSLMQRVNR